MAQNEPPYCQHGRPECTCLDDAITDATAAAQAAGAISVITTYQPATGGLETRLVSGYMAAFDPTAYSYIGTTATSGTAGQSNNFQWTYPPDTTVEPIPSRCEQEGHAIPENSLVCSGDDIWGRCEHCGDLVNIPRVAGSLNYERVGQYIGRAMTLDGAQDEGNGAELYVELDIFERLCKEELAKYERTLKMVELARGIAKRNLLQQD